MKKEIQYPNPSSGLFTVESIGVEGETQISLININGIEVYNESVHITNTGFKHELNLSSLGKGMYYIRFINTDFHYAEKILIK